MAFKLGTRIPDWNILSGKTGPPFQIFRCSWNFSAGTTQKGVSHFLSKWIFWKLFVNGEQPLLYMPIFKSTLKLPNL